QTVSGPSCGAATVTATATATAIPTETARRARTTAGAITKITVEASAGTSYAGLGYWQIFVTVDKRQFPATATLNFSDGASTPVAYNASSYIDGRYYGYFEWSGNLTGQFDSITGAFPAELNPQAQTVSGPSCGTATATATATAIPTETA